MKHIKAVQSKWKKLIFNIEWAHWFSSWKKKIASLNMVNRKWGVFLKHITQWPDKHIISSRSRCKQLRHKKKPKQCPNNYNRYCSSLFTATIIIASFFTEKRDKDDWNEEHFTSQWPNSIVFVYNTVNDLLVEGFGRWVFLFVVDSNFLVLPDEIFQKTVTLVLKQQTHLTNSGVVSGSQHLQRLMLSWKKIISF